jgi:hypothetical protein
MMDRQIMGRMITSLSGRHGCTGRLALPSFTCLRQTALARRKPAELANPDFPDA